MTLPPILVEDAGMALDVKWGIQIEKLESAVGTFTYKVVVPSHYPSFVGHFPGEPVLPAVSIINISVELISQQHIGFSQTDFILEKTKFKSMIQPNQALIVQYQELQTHSYQVIWKKEVNSEECAIVHLSWK